MKYRFTSPTKVITPTWKKCCAELPKKYSRRIWKGKYKNLKHWSIDELTIKEYPFVTLRINTNTWVEASVNYPADPKQASAVRTEIIKKAVRELLRESDKTIFPKSNAR